jgi:D-aminopeptidase
VLVLANFGSRADLRVAGVPVGGLLAHTDEPEPTPGGSCIAVVAVEDPVSSHDLGRVARRAGLGLARTGSVAHHGSGEIFVAFSSASADGPPRAGRDLDDMFEAVVDATEEAVLNALWAAPEVVGREGRVARALPHENVLEILQAHGRLDR